MEIIDDQPDDTTKPESETHELDGHKIQKFTALRRGAIRARSWCLITAAVCIVGSIQLLINTAQLIRHNSGRGVRPVLYILFAIAGVYAAAYALRRARALKTEINKPLLEDPQTPPDFSNLNDGSQRWENLNNIH